MQYVATSQPQRPRLGRKVTLTWRGEWGQAWRAAEQTEGGSDLLWEGPLSYSRNSGGAKIRGHWGELNLVIKDPYREEGSSIPFPDVPPVCSRGALWVASIMSPSPSCRFFKACVLMSKCRWQLGWGQLPAESAHTPPPPQCAKSGGHPGWAGCAAPSWGPGQGLPKGKFTRWGTNETWNSLGFSPELDWVSQPPQRDLSEQNSD